MDVIQTVRNIINALNSVKVQGEENMGPLLASISALRQVVDELSKQQTKSEQTVDPEEDDLK